MINWRVVQERAEAEKIPDGLSVTETPLAFYYRFRIGNDICMVRIEKDPLKIDYVDIHRSN